MRTLAMVALAVLLSLHAVAQPALSPRVQRVRELYDRLYYAEAAKVCELALHHGGNTMAEMVYLLGFQGLIAAAQGKHAAAVTAFKQMLAIDPRAKLGRGQAPRIVAAYGQAQKWVSEKGPLALAVSAPTSTLRGGAVEITAVVASDPLGLVHHAVLYLRASGTTSWEERPAPPGAKQRWSLDLGVLPGAERAAAVEYYVALLDRERNEVALSGKASQPRRIALGGGEGALPSSAPASAPAGQPPLPAQPAAGISLVRAWWFWTVIGVAATGTIVAIGVAASSKPSTIAAPISVEVR